MVVFLSWSGKKSKHVAAALNQWLPLLINTVEPWLSSENIEPGARWSPEIAAKLEAANVGIICVSQSNVAEPWIVFEAGALSKIAGASRVAVLAIDIKQADITGPLSQFQATTLSKDDVYKLVCMMNRNGAASLVPQDQLSRAFEALWPLLEAQLATLPTETETHRARRGQTDLLDEILTLVRTQDARNREFEQRISHILSINRDIMLEQVSFRNALAHDSAVRHESALRRHGPQSLWDKKTDARRSVVVNIVSELRPNQRIRTRFVDAGIKVLLDDSDGHVFEFIVPNDVVTEDEMRTSIKNMLS